MVPRGKEEPNPSSPTQLQSLGTVSANCGVHSMTPGNDTQTAEVNSSRHLSPFQFCQSTKPTQEDRVCPSFRTWVLRPEGQGGRNSKITTG